MAEFDDNICVHVWAPFTMEQYQEMTSAHGTSWTTRGTKCTKVFCQKCKQVEKIVDTTTTHSALPVEGGF